MAIDQEMITAVNQALAGDEAGFCTIYTKTYSYVYSRCRMIMKNDDDANDLLQETYIAAYKSLESLENVNGIYSWLGSIAYNQGMKLFRKRKDVLLDEDGQGLFEVQENADMSVVPGHDLEKKEVADIMKDIIEELPESQRAVVLAYYYDGMSVGQIADMMETSTGTIKSRLNYARKHIEDSVTAKEKQMGIRLHSSFAPIVIIALRAMVSQVPMSAETAGAGYAVISGRVGLTAALGTVIGEGVAGGAASGAISSAAGGGTVGGMAASTAGSVASGTVGGMAASTAATGSGFALTAVKVAVAVVLVGAGTAVVTHYVNSNKTTEVMEVQTQVTTEADEGTNVQDSSESLESNNKESSVDSSTTEKTATTKVTTETATSTTTEATTEATTTEATTAATTQASTRPEIESVEQSTQATTQASTKSKSNDQELEFDDMGF